MLEWKEPNRYNKRLNPCLATSQLETIWSKERCTLIILPSKSSTMQRVEEDIKGQVRLRHCRPQWRTNQGVWQPLDQMVMPKLTTHWIHMQQQNRGINGANLMDTQHVHAGWLPKIWHTCYHVPISCHPTAL